MEDEPCEADAGRTMAPRQHAWRFARRPRRNETAQIRPVAFGKTKIGALVAQAFARRLKEVAPPRGY